MVRMIVRMNQPEKARPSLHVDGGDLQMSCFMNFMRGLRQLGEQSCVGSVHQMARTMFTSLANVVKHTHSSRTPQLSHEPL